MDIEGEILPEAKSAPKKSPCQIYVTAALYLMSISIVFFVMATLPKEDASAKASMAMSGIISFQSLGQESKLYLFKQFIRKYGRQVQ